MSTFEELANEMSPPGIRRRGLATGAMRGPAPGYPGSAAPSAGVPRHSEPSNPSFIECPPCKADRKFHEALAGLPTESPPHGSFYLVSRPAHSYDSSFGGFSERLTRLLEAERLPALSGACAGDLLFLDIETTGLSAGVPLFLIGALCCEGAQARLDLYLARTFEEERALLAEFLEAARGKVLITFNGLSFDWPFILGRARAHGLKSHAPRGHLDLLHHARRHWRHRVPNCRLQTLELYLCGRTRQGDVPSSEIPAQYHRFVRIYEATGCGADLMAPMLHHNALDVLTMAELLCLAGDM